MLIAVADLLHRHPWQRQRAFKQCLMALVSPVCYAFCAVHCRLHQRKVFSDGAYISVCQQMVLQNKWQYQQNAFHQNERNKGNNSISLGFCRTNRPVTFFIYDILNDIDCDCNNRKESVYAHKSKNKRIISSCYGAWRVEFELKQIIIFWNNHADNCRHHQYSSINDVVYYNRLVNLDMVFVLVFGNIIRQLAVQQDKSHNHNQRITIP